MKYLMLGLAGAFAVTAWIVPVEGAFAHTICLSICSAVAATGLLLACLLGKGQRHSAAFVALAAIVSSCATTAPLVRVMEHRYFDLSLRAMNQKLFLERVRSENDNVLEPQKKETP